jgi:predicted dinucleotide-binding enzyme
MTSFTILGTGNMGEAIGALLNEGGSEVDHVGHAGTGSQPLTGTIVILAVPHPALDEVVTVYGQELAGKTVVDITNPLNFETFDSLVVPPGESSASGLAAKLPGSRVLKAFNTNFAATLRSKKTGDLPTTVLIAGDDADAKAALVAAVTAGGVAALDVGSLKRAHELEALGFLQLTLAVNDQLSWTGGFAVAG